MWATLGSNYLDGCGTYRTIIYSLAPSSIYLDDQSACHQSCGKTLPPDDHNLLSINIASINTCYSLLYGYWLLVSSIFFRNIWNEYQSQNTDSAEDCQRECQENIKPDFLPTTVDIRNWQNNSKITSNSQNQTISLG